MSFIKLEGRRIQLRDWIMTDLPDYEKWNTGSHRWMDFNGPYYANMSQEELAQKISKARQRILQNSFVAPRQLLIIADKQSQKLLGTCGWYWQSRETHWMSQGLVLYDPDSWSKGIGREALGLWCQYLLDNFAKLARLDLRTWSGNHGMMKLALKLGFEQEACFKKARIINGVYYDSIGYGILREQWDQLYPEGFGQSLKT